MHGQRSLAIVLVVVCHVFLLNGQEQLSDQLLDNLSLIKLPPGFSIRPYSTLKVPGARILTLGLAVGNSTIVYVSSNAAGSVTALVDSDFDGVAETSCVLLTGLQSPNGIVWHRGSLYVAETERLSRFDGTDFAVLSGCNSSMVQSTLLTQLPPQAGHGARALALSPEEMLYLSVAAPFNVGQCTDLYCTLQRVHLNGTGMETFASGVRNVGGVAWSDDPALPGTFFSVIERDQMGDDAPDDNIVYAEQAGTFWGFPYCHWVGTGDPYRRDPGPGVPLADDQMVPPGVQIDGLPTNDTLGPWCAANIPPPLQAAGPHLTPLDIAFYPSSPEGLPAQEGGPWPQQLFPEEYWGRLFMAQHGSWNREVPIGYRLATVEVSPEAKSIGHEVFADGWLQELGPANRGAWGRPVGLLVLPDGSLLVAGDYEGAVYRITYEGS